MRDISELIKREKPVEKLSDDEVARRMIDEDIRSINTFKPRQPARQKQSIGKRPWT